MKNKNLVKFALGALLMIALIYFAQSRACAGIADTQCYPTAEPTVTPTELPDYCLEDHGYQPYGPCESEIIEPTVRVTNVPELHPSATPFHPTHTAFHPTPTEVPLPTVCPRRNKGGICL